MKSDLRPRVIVEDIDVIEKRRHRARKHMTWRDHLRGGKPETQIYRQLWRYILPYRLTLAVALAMGLVAGAAAAAYMLVLKRMLEPILSPGSGAGPLATTLARCADALRGSETTVLGLSLEPVVLAGKSALTMIALTWSRIGPSEQLALATAVFFGMIVFEQVNKYNQRLLMRTVALDLVRELRAALFDRLMSLSMRFFHKNPSGRLLSRITNDLNRLGGVLVDVIVIYFTDFFTILFLLVLLWSEGGSLLLLGLLIGVVSLIPVQQLGKRIRRKEHDNQKKMGSIFSAITEVLMAQKIVKAFGAEDHERRRFADINERYTDSRKKTVALRARTGPLIEIFGALGICLLLWYGGHRVLAGSWDQPTFFIVLFTILRIVGALRRTGETSAKLQMGLAAADRVGTVIESQPEIVDAPDAGELQGVGRGIAFRDVSFSYDPGMPVLRGVSFELERGRSLALVGPTGSGKSTISDLLPRFYDVDSGAVLVDGRDVREYTVASLREHIAMVTQDTILFRDTVAANIAYAHPDTPMEDIVRAAKAAHAHDFIERMPEGYDSLVGERGVTLSGGERQRIAIARALLMDAPILILDEATSALDSQAEILVQQALDKLRAGRTSIIIAHRLSTIRDADTILVIDAGEIVERGTHDALLASDGLYAQLHRMQNRGG